MNGSLLDFSYLRDAVKAWEVRRDPLDHPTGIASQYGDQLSRLMQPADLQRLILLTSSAIPWIHLKNFHPNSVLAGDTPTKLLPDRGDPKWWCAAYATLALVGALKLRVVSYTCESQGWVFVHLTPKPGSGADAQYSSEAMAGHTDALHFPFPNEFDNSKNLPPPAPDFVVLTGIRNPEGVNTLVARLSTLLENISSRAQDSLRKPIFLFRNQSSFTTNTLIGYPVISRDSKYGDFVRFSGTRVSADFERFPEAFGALEEMKTALPKCREPICVLPGDVLLVNNRTALHGRDAVEKQEHPGQTRWLLRTYGYRLDTPGRFKDAQNPHLLSCEL
jgi:L-asparagine oxygenase